MYEKAVSGSGDRTLLEEAAMGTKQLSAGNSSADWKVTDYIYDIALSVPQVLTESSESSIITYEYGLERIAAYSTDGGKSTSKTQYVHDAGGSVVQTVSYTLTSELKATTAAPEVMSYSYTPFGEQLGEIVPGYGYNGEFYDAASGMLNLRARMYEPMAMRFNQRDLVSGNVGDTITINRYLYCQNNPLSFCDPMGTSVLSKLKSAAKSVAKAVKSTVAAAVDKRISTAAKIVQKAATVVNKVSTTVAKVSSTVSKAAQAVAANSNSKIVQSVANKVANKADKVTQTAEKVADVSQKVADVSGQIAETFDKKAADSWQDAKENFADTKQNIKEAAKEAVRHLDISCSEPSNLEEMFPTINNHRQDCVAVQITGNTVNITVYADFHGNEDLIIGNSGKTYKELVIEGFEAWGGKYTENDAVFGFDSEVIVTVQENDNGMDIFLEQGAGRSHVYKSASGSTSSSFWESLWDNVFDPGHGGWSTTSDRSMYLYTDTSSGQLTRTPTQISSTAAHEFGHVLGIGDAYAEDNWTFGSDLRPAASSTDADKYGIMRNHWKGINVSDKEIQLLLYAFDNNEWQTYTTYGDYTRSEALDE